MDIWQILMTPFSLLLRFFCLLFNSYGLALILFTVIVKIILFPFSIKGKRAMIKTSILSGQVQEIQRRCGNDKERANQEIQKLYAESGTSMFGGCGWSFLPLLILMPLYAIIRRPFKYMMMLKEEATTAIAGALGWAEFTPVGTNELILASMMNKGNLDTAVAAAGASTAGAFGMFVINFNFLGIDLSRIPSLMFWKSELFTSGDIWGAVGLFLLPLISAVLSFLSYEVSMRTNKMTQNQPENQQNNWMMRLMGPIMSLWIGYTLPAGLCIYWIANSLLMMIQEVIAGKMLKKDYEAAQREMEEQKRKSKEAEKERRRKSAERKAAALAAGSKKQPKKEKTASDVGGASQEGMRRFARGRAYDPARYPVTPYHDPNGPARPKEEDQPLTDEEKALLAESSPELAAAVKQAEEKAAESAAVEEAVQGEAEETPAAQEPASDDPEAGAAPESAGDYEEAYAPEDEEH